MICFLNWLQKRDINFAEEVVHDLLQQQGTYSMFNDKEYAKRGVRSNYIARMKSKPKTLKPTKRKSK